MVSIIVPTYNRGGARDIINSILRQTYKDFELIIVNDGSKDNTAEVLADLAKKDKRINVINKQNGGPSAARNDGINIATGQYLFFIDDDDDVPVDYIEKFMLPEYDNIDLVIDSYSNQRDDNQPIKKHFPIVGLNSKKETLEYVLVEMRKHPYCFFSVGKRFKTSIFHENHIRYNPHISLGEDRIMCLDYIRTNEFKTCQFIDNSAYIVKESSTATYRLSQGGHKPITELWNNFSIIYKYQLQLANEYGMPGVKTSADHYLVTKVFSYILIPLSSSCKEAERKFLKEEIAKGVRIANLHNVKQRDARIAANLLTKVSPTSALTFVKVRLSLGAFIRKIIK